MDLVNFGINKKKISKDFYLIFVFLFLFNFYPIVELKWSCDEYVIVVSLRFVA